MATRNRLCFALLLLQLDQHLPSNLPPLAASCSGCYRVSKLDRIHSWEDRCFSQVTLV